MVNRLRNSTSPYLLQHADNPVDWWPWSDEAFAEAARRDVPVMLSVGYAACHWCHVMAHESFEDPETAAVLNERVVAIKVDREERPDVDAVYMTATQAMTGQGGWPMTVFMTPAGEPFFCGTYFPRANFTQLVLNIARAWSGQRADVTDRAKQIAAALAENASATAQALRGPGGDQEHRFGEVTDAAVAALEHGYDDQAGGFGGAPKFPPSMVLEFLLRHHQRTGPPQARADGVDGPLQAGVPDALQAEVDGAPQAGVDSIGVDGAGVPDALRLAAGTCEAMARGGMYDQLGGGFARYSVDAGWVVPHFEKMLYDNALLTRVYINLWRITGSELARRVAQETCDWMLRELRTAEGGLAASLDADSEGEEGKFYVWRPAELSAVLGPQDGEFAAQVFGVTGAGTFEHGASVLQRRAEPPDAGRLDRVRSALLAARASRVRPARDDKVVAAWNGLAISALAECGLLLGRPDFIMAARAAANLLATVHLADGRLIRTSRDGIAGAAAARGAAEARGAGAGAVPDSTASGTAGVLEDYACVAEGFLTLSGVTGEARWLTLAGELLEVALDAFGDGAGGFYDTAADGETLIFRPADPADNATPSGTFAVAGALLSYSALTGSARHREAAAAALGVLPAIAARYPRAAGAGLSVAEAWLAGPAEIAVVGNPEDERTQALHRTALHAATPGAVLALGDGTQAVGTQAVGTQAVGTQAVGTQAVGTQAVGTQAVGTQAGGPEEVDLEEVGPEAVVPLLAGRGLVDGGPAAYVCRHFTCLAPVTTPQQLREVLAGPS